MTRGLTPDRRTNETIAFACDAGVRAGIDCSRRRDVSSPALNDHIPKDWAHMYSRMFRNGRFDLGHQLMRGRSNTRPVDNREPLELLLDSGFQAGGLVPGYLEWGPAFSKTTFTLLHRQAKVALALPAVLRGRVRAKPAASRLQSLGFRLAAFHLLSAPYASPHVLIHPEDLADGTVPRKTAHLLVTPLFEFFPQVGIDQHPVRGPHDFENVFRIHQHRRVAHHLGEGRDIGSNDGGAVRHRLQGREAETFVK